MNFDLYFPFVGKSDGETKPGVRPKRKSWEDIKAIMRTARVKELVEAVRAGDKSKKIELPAICWTGWSKKEYRRADAMEPTQMVMCDIDHCEDPRAAWEKIQQSENYKLVSDYMTVVHVTPSGKGLRLVFRAVADYPTLREHMNWLNELLDLGSYGDFDTAVKDFSRISFLVPESEILYENLHILTSDRTFEFTPLKSDVEQGEAPKIPATAGKKDEEGRLFDNTSVNDFTEEEIAKFKEYHYRGCELPIIVEKYVEVMGKPSSGEIHNYYNEMVKNFRCICDNNKRLLLWLLPRFGHTIDECWSQIVSICRVNTLSRLPKSFYFFLKDNGFYSGREEKSDGLKEYMLSEEEKSLDLPPYLPPVFRELVGSAPVDFVLPCVNSLLPIMGTLTSYLKAVYPYDNREHTTSFFSVIYAPPGTGKGFVERFLDLLFEDLKLRDYIQSERENVYLRVIQRKGANDKAPEMPHTSLRIIPPKNSEAEFLQKQKDNQGYHMFTYAAEMDSWAKGVKAAGGNKDDMIRIAWDNGEYGQQFKSANTFKGTVRLFWNVLITGTIAQVESYFKNVENGLVTRCSFTPIENQEFAEAPRWKEISKRGMATIKTFMQRCDARTYETPCTVNILDVESCSDDEFDKVIDWKFKFKERRMIDMSWLMPTIDAFHKEQMRLAALDIDRARDVFRRRVGVRGFRLGMICYGCWEQPRPSDLQKCIPFIWWWMHKDIECMLNLWGARYNEQADVSPVLVQRNVFNALPEEFNKNDIYVVCMKQGIKTPVRHIVFDWKKLGYITKIDKDHFKKNVKK